MEELKLQTEIGELTAVFVPDEKIGGYTSYFKERPNVVAEGDNLNEAIENLQNLFSKVLEHERNDGK